MLGFSEFRPGPQTTYCVQIQMQLAGQRSELKQTNIGNREIHLSQPMPSMSLHTAVLSRIKI